MRKPSPHNFEQLIRLGIAHHQENRFEQAKFCYQKILTLQPSHAEANFLLGTLAHQVGRGDVAIPLISKAIDKDPGRADYHGNLGLILFEQGRLKDAAAACRRALRIQPDFAAAHNNLGNVLKAEGRREKAIECYRKALRINPDFVEAYNNLGDALDELGRFDDAVAAYQNAVRIDPGFAMAHYNLGVALSSREKWEDAVVSYEKAVRINRLLVEGHYNLATALKALGRMDAAEAAYRTVLELTPERAEARYNLALMRTHTAYDDDIKAMETQYAGATCSDSQKTFLAFGLGKVFEDIQQYDQAFSFLSEGNRLRRSLLTYESDRDAEIFRWVQETFNAAFFYSRDSAGFGDDTPIFILGMPRSGTSLVEQILSSHHQVAGAGEISDLSDTCLAGGKSITEGFLERVSALKPSAFHNLGAAYIEKLRKRFSEEKHVTDKMPDNFFYIGMIRLMLPNARVIHCRRDPVDTCFSIFKNNFAEGMFYAYDLTELGRYYRLYSKLMDHWRAVLPGFVHDVQYEDLVSDPEIQIRRLLDLCGLPFDPACLSFHESKRVVLTASDRQVRRPIYRDSVRLWKRYEIQLKPLLRALR